MRRNKRDMELMKDDCTYYLLQTKNDYRKAYDLFIKDHLENKRMIPYYVKGIKDFLKISEELAIKLNQKEQMKKADKQRYEDKQTIVNFIMNLTVEEMKVIYKQYKDIVSKSDKLVLHEVYFFKYENEFQEKHIDQHVINVFTPIYKESLQPA
jgi:superfamily I DNA and/or RNA helicase